MQNGNSYILATDWAIVTIFGMLIENLKKMQYWSKIVNVKTAEVKLRHSGRHLQNRHISADNGEMWHADAEWHDSYGDKVKIETESFSPELHNCIIC